MTFWLAKPGRSNLRLLASTILTVLASVTGCYAENLLSEPGFESNVLGQKILGWNSYGSNTYVTANPAPVHGGTNSLKVYQAFTGAVNYNGIYQDYISGPGAVYSADGWAYNAAAAALAGQNSAWIEVSFRDANAKILTLYRSALINTQAIADGTFSANTWVNLSVTNQYDPNSYQIINRTSRLVAPPGTYFVRYQIMFQGDAQNSRGSVYFDDLNLSRTDGAAYGNWSLAWSDEFNGTAIDKNTWTYDLGASGWGNNELEDYTSNAANAYVTGGCLHIAVLKPSAENRHYTSARLKSQGLFSFQYGRLEWRAQLPHGKGFWPALWLLGTNISTVGWPGCGEIDVVENKGSDLQMDQGSLHSGSDETVIYRFLNGDSVTNFHTYTLDWTPTAILFYVDGHLYESQTRWTSSQGAYPAPFNQPFFLLMNIAVGGNYLDNPTPAAINAQSSFPGEMLVDYVRLYNLTGNKNEN